VKCETLTQVPVDPHIIDKGIPTTGLLAQVLVAKYRYWQMTVDGPKQTGVGQWLTGSNRGPTVIRAALESCETSQPILNSLTITAA
jgi:hypothetical protein